MCDADLPEESIPRSPSTLGVSAAATFGANFSIIVLGAGAVISASSGAVTISRPYLVTVSAFACSLGAVLLILALSRLRGFSPESIVLAGTALSSLFTAGTTIIQYFGDDMGIAAAVFWTFGDLGRVSWQENGMMALAVGAALVYFLFMRWNYNAMANGEELARSLGVKTSRVRFWGLLLSSLLTAVCVAFMGMIGFIGLIAPQIMKRMIGSDHRFLIPASALLGAAVLLLADTVARSVISPVILPVGAVTSLFRGAPFLLSAVKGEKSKMRLEVRELRYGYTPEREVVKGVSFAVQAGECMAVLGTNGVGDGHRCSNASTAFCGPRQGKYWWMGCLSAGFLGGSWPSGSAMSPEGCEFADSSVFDAVLLGRKPFLQWDVTKGDLEIVQEVLKRMGLEEYANRDVNALSGGEQQKVSIARALAQQAPVLLFDEPTSSLDLRNQLEVLDITKQVVRQQALAAAAILHDLNLALRFADRFLVMKDGGGACPRRAGSGRPGDDLGSVLASGHRCWKWTGGRWWFPDDRCERSFRMRVWRKGLALFAAGALVLGLAACGGPEEERGGAGAISAAGSAGGGDGHGRAFGCHSRWGGQFRLHRRPVACVCTAMWRRKAGLRG